MLLAAISLGFLGSFHCIGMCGPIALSLPIGQKRGIAKTVSIFAYNSGRVVSYGGIGLLFGSIGQSVALFGYQQLLSVVLGILILAGLLLPKTILTVINPNSLIYRFFHSVKQTLTRQFQKNGIRSLFSIGLLNGLLPCGLVYMGISGAIATGSALQGMLFMMVFGLGTLPFLFSISYTSNFISIRMRQTIRKAVPFVVGTMACLLIMRGMNLGIPYLSPKFDNTQTAMQPGCHTTITCSPSTNK